MSMNFEAFDLMAKSEQRLRDLQYNQAAKYAIPTAILRRQEPAGQVLPLLKRGIKLFNR